MSRSFEHVDRLIVDGMADKLFSGAAIAVGDTQGVRHKACYGRISRVADSSVVHEGTLFDLASMTKVVSTTMLALIFIDRGWLSIDYKVADFFETPIDKETITIRHLLTHTSGMKAGILLNRVSSSILDVPHAILRQPLEQDVGKDVIYSCTGYILLGKILEQVGKAPIDVLTKAYVLDPLVLESTTHQPEGNDIAVMAYVKELGGYAKGIVHDGNGRYLKGASGNAGLFSTIKDMERFAWMLLRWATTEQDGLFSKSLFMDAISNQTEGKSFSRGYGFSLKDNNDHPAGDRASYRCFGHTGYTGTFLWVDPRDEVYVAFLSNRIHYTEELDKYHQFRRTLMNTIGRLLR